MSPTDGGAYSTVITILAVTFMVPERRTRTHRSGVRIVSLLVPSVVINSDNLHTASGTQRYQTKCESGTCPLRPDRIGQNVVVALLEQQRGMVGLVERKTECPTCIPDTTVQVNGVQQGDYDARKRTVEVFSAGCGCCEDAIVLVKKIACPSCEITIHDMEKPEVAERAKHLGVRSVPAVVIEGKLAGCCAGRGPEEGALRSAGLGMAL